MKNVKLLCMALLVAGSANAQYFQHLYGSQRSEHLESGVNADLTVALQGHIMDGYTDFTSTGFNQLMVTSTDLNGKTPPNFNNTYNIIEPNQPQIDVKGRRVVQYGFPFYNANVAGDVAVWGDFGYASHGVSTKFFYALLGANGVPIPGAISSYALPFPVAEVEATSMCVSRSQATAGDVFVCGWYRTTIGGPRTPIAMRLKAATGGMVWSWDYLIPNSPTAVDWAAMDLVESPYPACNGVTDIAITGQYTQPNPSNPFLTGYYTTVDAATGMPSLGCIGAVVTYGSPNATSVLNAIDIAQNPYGNGPGFVMAGTSNFQGGDDCWAIKIDPLGNVNFSRLMDYNPSDKNYGNDIIERINTAGTFEYYVGGYVNNGRFGKNDDVVFKLDAAGLPVTSGQFTFGGPGNEQCMQLDQYNNIPPMPGQDFDGLSVYGNTDGGSWPVPPVGAPDFYLVKSYFNGLTKCNWDTVSFDSIPGPGRFETWQSRVRNRLVPGPLFIQFSPMQDWEICWAPQIFGGSNARLAQTEQQLSQPGYFPNPVSRDNAIINVTFGNAAVTGDADIELWNAIGQLVWTKKTSLTNGQTQMQVDLGNELSGGMYHLIVRQNGNVNNYRIVVQ
jgi:hypothetical protein